MTTKRRVKKEIDYFVSDLILDCFTYASVTKNPEDAETLEIVSETLSLRNELRDRANHPERRNESDSVKSFYDKLADDLIKGVDTGYDKLRKLAAGRE